MKALLFLAALVGASSAAEARTYVRVHPSQPIYEVRRTEAQIVCPWVTGAVAWDWPRAKQKLALGICPPPAAPRI